MAAGNGIYSREITYYYGPSSNRSSDASFNYVARYYCDYWRPEVVAAILAREAEEAELYFSEHRGAVLYEIPLEEDEEVEDILTGNKNRNERNSNSPLALQSGGIVEILTEEANEIPNPEEQTGHATIGGCILSWLDQFKKHFRKLPRFFCWPHA